MGAAFGLVYSGDTEFEGMAGALLEACWEDQSIGGGGDLPHKQEE